MYIIKFICDQVYFKSHAPQYRPLSTVKLCCALNIQHSIEV